MTVNFKHLLNKPAGHAPVPQALPAADYPGKIKSFENIESSQKKTPAIRFQLAVVGWPDSVDEADRFIQDPDGNNVPIDLSKKQLKVDYYLTDGSLHRLDKLLRDLGVLGDGTRSYEELIPELVGMDVTIPVRQETNDKGDEVRTYNKVEELAAAA